MIYYFSDYNFLSVVNQFEFKLCKIGINISDPAISESWAKVIGTYDENWVLLHLPSPNSAAVYKLGSTFEDLINNGIDDENVYFGAIKLTIESKIKFFKFSFIGSNVSGMRKAKV